MTIRLGFNTAMLRDHPYLSGFMGSVMIAGHVGIGEAISTHLMIFPTMGGALFGGCFIVGGIIAWVVDYVTDATACFGGSNLAQIARVALYAIFSAVIVTGIVSLAGFSVVIVDIAKLAGLMMLLDVLIFINI